VASEGIPWLRELKVVTVWHTGYSIFPKLSTVFEDALNCPLREWQVSCTTRWVLVNLMIESTVDQSYLWPSCDVSLLRHRLSGRSDSVASCGRTDNEVNLLVYRHQASRSRSNPNRLGVGWHSLVNHKLMASIRTCKPDWGVRRRPRHKRVDWAVYRVMIDGTRIIGGRYRKIGVECALSDYKVPSALRHWVRVTSNVSKQVESPAWTRKREIFVTANSDCKRLVSTSTHCDSIDSERNCQRCVVTHVKPGRIPAFIVL